MRTGRHCAAEFFVDQRAFDEGLAPSAVALGNEQAIQAELPHLLPERVRVALGIVFRLADDLDARMFFEQSARHVDDHLLLFCEVEIHRESPRNSSAGRGGAER